MTFKPRVPTLAATVGALVGVFGLAILVTRPWTLSAQLPALVLLLVGESVFVASRLRGAARAKTVAVIYRS